MDPSPGEMRPFNSASIQLSLACSSPTYSSGREEVRARWIALLCSLKRVDSRQSAVVFPVFPGRGGENDWYSCFQLRKHFPKLVKNVIILLVISFEVLTARAQERYKMMENWLIRKMRITFEALVGRQHLTEGGSRERSKQAFFKVAIS